MINRDYWEILSTTWGNSPFKHRTHMGGNFTLLTSVNYENKNRSSDFTIRDDFGTASVILMSSSRFDARTAYRLSQRSAYLAQTNFTSPFRILLVPLSVTIIFTVFKNSSSTIRSGPQILTPLLILSLVSQLPDSMQLNYSCSLMVPAPANSMYSVLFTLTSRHPNQNSLKRLLASNWNVLWWNEIHILVIEKVRVSVILHPLSEHFRRLNCNPQCFPYIYYSLVMLILPFRFVIKHQQIWQTPLFWYLAPHEIII